MFAVGLREHHQFHVARVAAQAREGGDEVVDLVVGQGEAERRIRGHQRRAALPQHVDMRQRRGHLHFEQPRRGFALEGHALGHAVVQQRGHGSALVVGKGLGCGHQARLQREPEFGHAFDTVHRQPAVARDVGGLAGPRRHRAQARHHHHQLAGADTGVGRAVVQQALQAVQLSAQRCGVESRPVHEARGHRGDARAGGLQTRQQGLGAEGRERVAALEVHKMEGRCAHSVPAGRGNEGF